MNIRSRLDKLERDTGVKSGRCPGCGFRPDDIRTIEIGRHPQPGEAERPLAESWPIIDDQPGRLRCAICGDYMPPIAFLRADGPGRRDLAAEPSGWEGL